MRDLPDRVHCGFGVGSRDCPCQAQWVGSIDVVVQLIEEFLAQPMASGQDIRPVPARAELPQVVGDGVIVSGSLSQHKDAHQTPPRVDEQWCVQDPILVEHL